MEEDKGGAGAPPSRVSPSPVPSAPAAPQPPSTSSNPSKESIAPMKRQMFSVELKPGETTIVSWKKLLKEAGKGSGNPLDLIAPDSPAGPGADPAAAAADAVPPLDGDGELQDAQPSNRFSAVIEKIERLYMGKQSSDEEELDDVPDDDQYDTEDSFIDDAELDEYFQVDKLSTKHNGYFVNRGKLEKVEASSSPNLAPKKRRRKDSTKVSTEANQEEVIGGPLTMGNVRIKAAARTAPLVGKKSANPTKIQAPYGDHYQEGKFLKNKHDISMGTYKKKSADPMTNLEDASSGRISKDVSTRFLESKDVDKHKAGVLPSKDLTHKSRPINESADSVHHASRDRGVCSPVESQSRKTLNYENQGEISSKIRRKERYGTDGFPNMDSAVSAYPFKPLKPSSARVKDGCAIRPKGTTLERAICDLEKIVALCRPPKLDVQEVDAASQGVKRRLPQEVKQKLAKVARLSASQSKISEEDLIDRLMGIVGHIVQRKTLKRNMREMVELGLSAKQEKSDRLQQIKKEVNEMIRTRVSLLKSKMAEQPDGSADDFQDNGSEERRAVRKYGVDILLEDKICELYDLYVEGLDEDKGPLSRKLYGELADLWPNGCMDNNGIKDIIFRSRERKRSRTYRHKAREEERIKRKKLASAARMEGPSLGDGTLVQSAHERAATESTAQVLASSEKVPTNQPVTSGRLVEPTPQLSDSGHHHVSKHHEKARISTSMGLDNGSKTAVTDMKKKLKRKPESDLGDIHVHPTKLPSQSGKERPSSQKHSDDSSSFHQAKQILQLSGTAASSDQQN